MQNSIVINFNKNAEIRTRKYNNGIINVKEKPVCVYYDGGLFVNFVCMNFYILHENNATISSK